METQQATLEDWVRFEASLSDYLNDIAKHGASAGFPGITYYKDTVALYDQYSDEIWEALYEDAGAFGQTIPELIASFGGAKDVGSDCQFKNLLVWYFVERIANQYSESI